MKLDWFANPEPDIAGYKIYYGGQAGNYTNIINVGNTTNATVVGLVGGATYFFVATAYNTQGLESQPSTEISYTVPPQGSTITAPLAITESAVVSGSNSAVLNGLVDPNGATTYAWFEYGLTTSYGTSTTPTNLGAGSAAVSLSRSISSLQPGTTYHFRCVATNALGISYGGDYIFTTAALTPTATTQPAGTVTANGAILNGSVNPNGSATLAWFEYGLTSSYGSQTALTNAGTGFSVVNVSRAITGLAAGTTYYFRLVSSNSAGTARGADMAFTTATIASLATVTTLPATVTGSSTATLNGSVNPNSTPTIVWFEFGLTTSYGLQTTSSSAGNGSAPLSISAPLTGLTPGATWHFRIVSSNSAGIARGSNMAFTTPPIDNLASVTTLPASGTGSSSATFNGSVNPNATPTVAWFEYGPDVTYGSNTLSTDVGAGTASMTLSSDVSGLDAATTYHFRLVSSNSAGISRGVDMSFTTQPPPNPPFASTLAGTATSSSAATLNGSVNPNGLATTAWFEFGPDTSYGFRTPDINAGSGFDSLSVMAQVTDLPPGQTWHFRVVAQNAAGTVFGLDQEFTMLGTEPTVSTLPVLSVSSHDAILYGSVTPASYNTTVYFEYGTTPGFGNTTPVLRLDPGYTLRHVTRKAPGLKPDSTYYFRLVAVASSGTVVGEIQSFTTPPR